MRYCLEKLNSTSLWHVNINLDYMECFLNFDRVHNYSSWEKKNEGYVINLQNKMYYIYSMKIPTCILYYLPISYYNPVEIKLSTLKCRTCSWHYVFMSTWCNSPILLSSQWLKTRGKTSCCQIMADWLWKIQKSDDSNIIIHNPESIWIQNYGLWESSKFQISHNRIFKIRHNQKQTGPM
jgi:hypothetical protein